MISLKKSLYNLSFRQTNANKEITRTFSIYAVDRRKCTFSLMGNIECDHISLLDSGSHEKRIHKYETLKVQLFLVYGIDHVYRVSIWS